MASLQLILSTMSFSENLVKLFLILTLQEQQLIGATSGKLFVTLAANDTLSTGDTIKVRLKQSQVFSTHTHK